MLRTLLLFFVLLSLTSCAGSDSSSKDTLTLRGDGVVYSEKFALMWQQDDSKRFSSAAEAQAYAEQLTLGGYDDWRIPTKAESHNLYFSMDFGETMVTDLGMKLDRSLWVQFADGTLVS